MTSSNNLAIISSAYGDVNVYVGGFVSGFQDGLGSNAAFQNPAGSALDSLGNLYVADAGNNAIRKVTPAGLVTTVAGNGTADYIDDIGTSAAFNHPTAVAIDASGNLYVADTGNNVIRKIDALTNVTTLNGSFSSPTGVAVDAIGNVYVADSGNNVIQKVTVNGMVSVYAGDTNFAGGYEDGRRALFSTPTSVAIDSVGNLYVSDTGNYAIRKIDTRRNVSTLAGGNGQGQSDGIDTKATFSSPGAITVDSLGTIYIIDNAIQNYINGPFYDYTTQLRIIAPANTWQVMRNGSGLTITGYNGLLSNAVTIPSQINGTPVTGIANGAFANNTNITSITVQSGISTIGSSAFSGCTALTSVSIPDSVINMGYNLLSGCPQLTSVSASVNLQDFLSLYAQELGISPLAVNNFTTSNQASLFSSIGQKIAVDPAFQAALTSQILNTPGNYGLATKSDLNALAAKSDLNALASNQSFVAALAANPVFLNALAAQLTSGAANYGVAIKDSQTLSFAPLTITYSKKSNKVTLAATSSAHLSPVVYSIANSSIGSISGNVLTLSGVKGITTITASQAGTHLVNPAPPVTVNLTVR